MLTDVFRQWVTIFTPPITFGVLTAGAVSSTSWLRRIHLPGRTTGFILSCTYRNTDGNGRYLVCWVKRLPRSFKREPPTNIVAKVPVHRELPFLMHLVVLQYSTVLTQSAEPNKLFTSLFYDSPQLTP